MKVQLMRAMLLVSIGCNVLLFMALIRAPKTDGSAQAAGSASGDMPGAPEEERRRTEDDPNVERFIKPAARQFSWKDIESADYREYIDNLRAVGCPEETIRELVQLDLKKHFEAQKWELVRSAARKKYWESSFQAGIELEGEALQELQGLDRQFAAAYSSLLGVEPDRRHSLKDVRHAEAEAASVHGDLTPETYQAIKTLLENSRAEQNELPLHDPGKEELWQKTQKQILALLSPHEREQHELRTAAEAKALRGSLAAFPITEGEFVEAFREMRRWSGVPGWQEEDAAVAALERVLPASRFQEYLKSRYPQSQAVVTP